MEYKEVYSKIVTPKNSKADLKWYLAPLVPAVLWIVISVVSIFTINFSIITNPFVIFSLIARLIIPLYAIHFIKKFYYVERVKLVNYTHILNVVGYGISLTYVAYMLPAVVLDFYESGQSSPVFTTFTILATLCPAALYLLLKTDNVKMSTGYYTKDELELEKKRKKDKSLKKKYQAKLRRERTMLQNFWFELLDPLMWAILWVLIINNTVFQLYQIPSSSMVPEFLEQDRVVATKIFSGPGLPLTRYKFPEISKPKVGEIVTFNNPEVDDPNSDLHYKNVFTRIFQPFVFMLTFSRLDIDTDDNGNPKARQLVKRVIGVPGEKLCIVNDKVYKKVEGGEWTLMSDIPGQKEWGHNDLFSTDSKNSGAQFMNPEIREDLDSAAQMALNLDLDSVVSQLKSEKTDLLNYIDRIDNNMFLNIISSYNRVNGSEVQKVVQDIEDSYRDMMQVNRTAASNSYKQNIVKDFTKNLDNYNEFIKYQKINDLAEILQMDRKLIDDEFKVNLTYPKDPSPYDEFVVNLDAIIKLKSLQIYNSILSSGEFTVSDTLLEDLKELSLYTDGIQFLTGSFPFFGAGNFPEYPVAKDEYIAKGEYFLLGDNRYNSLDSRMGDEYYNVSLNPNGGEFTEDLIVSWKPHTISDYYIHGKVKLILFPFNHFKIF